MPNGKTHTGATISLATLLVLSDQRWVGIGALSGVLLSPDLDVDNGFIGFRYIRNLPVIGPALSWLWRIMWRPYALLVKHRSWVSHMPVVSTLIRVGYMALFVIPVLYFLDLRPDIPEPALLALLGLIGADVLHAIMDVLSTWMKRR